MPGSSTRTKTRNRDAVMFNRLAKLDFGIIASVPAPTVVTTILDAVTLPVSCKIIGAAVYYLSNPSTLGTAKFNIVAGTGSYESTAGNGGNVVVTMGTPHTGDVITFAFVIPNQLLTNNGVPFSQAGQLGSPNNPNAVPINFVYTVKSTDTTSSILATSITQTFNGGSFSATQINGLQATYLSDIMFAGDIAGPVITFIGLQANVLNNGILLSTSVTGAGATTTATVTGLGFASASNNTGVTIGVNDQSEYFGLNTGTLPYSGNGGEWPTGTTTPSPPTYNGFNFAPAGSGALGATPIFQADMPLFTPSVGNSVYWATNWDTIYQQGSIMTLRMSTPSGAPVTGLKAKMLMFSYDVAPPNPTFPTFNPCNDIW